MVTEIANPSPFDAIRRMDERGEYWTGRDLMPLMEYAAWDKFAAVIEKAKASLALVQGAGQAEHHFTAWGSDGGRWGNQRLDDCRLTRFGAYLVAMAGDDTKPAVARARVYFAVKTREAEVAPVAQVHAIPQSFSEALRLAADEHERAERAEAKVLELAPKAAQADQHRAADGLTLVGDFANKVKAWAKREHNVRILHEQVWDFLGDIGLIIRGNTVRRNHPTAFAVERDFVRLKETEYVHPTGARTSASPRLTPAGEGWAWDRAVKRIAGHGSLKPSTAVEKRSA